MTHRAAEDAHQDDGRADDGSTLGAFWARVRRYWLLVLAVVWIAALGAVYSTHQAPTEYVGRTSLIVSSNDRSPEQDAVLVAGYISYFNDASYQGQLLDAAKVSGDVSLSAESAAASPIMVITATADDPVTAQTAAVATANAFKDDINAVHTQNTAQRLVALQDQLDTALASSSPDAQAVVVNLQNQMEQVKADQVDVLQDLQAQGGVTVQAPSLFTNLLLAVIGGLVIGVLAALVVGILSPQLRTRRDVADKLGVNTLVELPRRRGRAARTAQDKRLGQLANIVRSRLAGPGVVAVTQPEGGRASATVARELAHEWARQGYPTILVQAGAAGILDGARPAAPQVRSGRLRGLSLLQLVPVSDDDAPVVSISRVSEFLEHETLAGQYVVIEAPAVAQSPAAQAVCQGADQTVLVIDTKVTRVPLAREAVAVLRQMGARLLGAVVISVPEEQAAGGSEIPSTPSVGPAANRHRPAHAELAGHDGRPPVNGTPSAVATQGTRPGGE